MGDAPVLDQYRQVFDAFAAHYAPVAPMTSVIAIGLGAASELRHPSYNAHDVGAGSPGPRCPSRRLALRKAEPPAIRGAWIGHSTGVAKPFHDVRPFVASPFAGRVEGMEASAIAETLHHGCQVGRVVELVDNSPAEER